jgi:hypothetical protein
VQRSLILQEQIYSVAAYELQDDNKDHGYTLKDFAIETLPANRYNGAKKNTDLLNDYGVVVSTDENPAEVAEKSGVNEKIPNTACLTCSSRFKKDNYAQLCHMCVQDGSE